MLTKKILFLVCLAIIFLSCGSNQVQSFEKSSVKDCEGNEYVTVKFGNQWWMIENLRCAKFDTESKLFGTSLSLSTSAVVFTPYYTKISTTSTSIVGGVNYSINLTADQRLKLGYLYNWAAALGLTNGLVDTVFIDKQQGICPNGWHIPTDNDWTILTDFISKNTNGKYKTITGWFDNNNSSGTDATFAVLPAGYAQARTIKSLGFCSSFLSSTNSDSRHSINLYLSNRDDVIMKYNEVKSYATSVRCIKNE